MKGHWVARESESEFKSASTDFGEAVKSHEELAQQMKDRYGVEYNITALKRAGADPELMRQRAFSAFDFIQKNFGMVASRELKGKSISQQTMAQSEGLYTDYEQGIEPVVTLNTKYFNKADTISKAYANMGGSNFHPDNDTPTGTLVHELGHGLVAKIASRRVKSAVKSGEVKNLWDVKYMVDGTAKSIVDSAYKSIKGNSGVGSLKDERARISGYATQKYDETVAEAISDVYANKGKAKELSKAIFREVKSQLR